jgi:nucleoid DNA-binding protein
MTKSELIEILATKNSHLIHKDVELAVKSLLEQMSCALASGQGVWQLFAALPSAPHGQKSEDR